MGWCWLIKEAEKYYYWVNIHFGGLDSLEVVYYQLEGLGSLEPTMVGTIVGMHGAWTN